MSVFNAPEPEDRPRTEARKTFHDNLDQLSHDLVAMGSMVVELIPRGTQILLAGDLVGAEELIIGDDELDLASTDAEERCAQIIALQAPVAGDLRRVITCMHLISEIERSGDLVTNIAKGTRRLHGQAIDPKLRGYITRMGEEAQRLFRAAVDSFADEDEALASALDDMDDNMDTLHGDYIQALFESRHSQGAELQSAVQLALIGRYYERIGDHAVNIAERVQYMTAGWLPEHTGAARARARHAGETNADPAGPRSGADEA
ncbi:MAG TPA: phosphate signaling complex protein PhoU [Acidimicrobiales bacterium]